MSSRERSFTSKEKMKNYLQNRRNSFIEKVLGNTIVIAKDKLPDNVDIDVVLSTLKKLVPLSFFRDIDSIYIGQFQHLIDREVHAMYSDGAIYVTNNQASSTDLVEDIIHEVAHSLEESHTSEIYGDGKIEKEFLAKRQKLYFILKEEGYNTELSYFFETEYTEEFDSFLYKEVGYPMLSALSVNLFYSPYGATSLREYFANGFEAFFYHRDVHYLKKVSPNLFDKLQIIAYNKE